MSGVRPADHLRRMVALGIDALAEVTVVPSFSRIGHEVRSSLFDWSAMPSAALDGRVAVVTGATSGIGAALAAGLARLGATVHLVGRDADKVSSTADQIAAEVAGAQLVTHVADLGQLLDVVALGERLHELTDHIDVLAHVAGALVHDEQRTSDGLELTLQVHVIAPFLLTSRVRDLLTAADGPRVITMTSGGMYTQRLDVDALVHPDGEYDGTVTYARAKRAQVELNAEWARRHADDGIGFHVVHPGWVDTPGLRTSLPRFTRRLRPLLRTPEQGADTALWLAWTDEAAAPGGHLWHDRRRRHTVAVPWTRTPPGEAEQLWDTVTSLSGATDLGAAS